MGDGQRRDSESNPDRSAGPCRSEDGCSIQRRLLAALKERGPAPAPPGKRGEVLEQQRLGGTDNDVREQRLGSASVAVRPLRPSP